MTLLPRHEGVRGKLTGLVVLAGGGGGREVLEWPYTAGGEGVAPPGPPPPPETNNRPIVGQNEVYRWGNLVGPYLAPTLLGPRPPFPLLIPPAGGGGGGGGGGLETRGVEVALGVVGGALITSLHTAPPPPAGQHAGGHAGGRRPPSVRLPPRR